MTDFDPVLTMDQIHRARAAESEHGVIRRALMAIMTRSHAELHTAAAAAPEAFLSILEDARPAIEQRRADLEILEAARARLTLVLTEIVEAMPDDPPAAE